ncbi:hypothetical protein BH09MYX1_BH09MYX1_37940 [soil metagenome]
MTLIRRIFVAGVALAGIASIFACGPGLKSPIDATTKDGCGNLNNDACGRAKGLLAAANAFSNVEHSYLLAATSSFAPGRGLARGATGTWSALPTACARTPPDQGKVDAATVDFGFIGVSIDSVLLSADADVSPLFSAGGSAGQHTLRLVAIAFVRDLDPQFFDASEEITYASDSCACRNATHFVGAVKMGGMLAYETTVREGEVHAKALEFVKAKLSAKGAAITETRVGGLEVEGLETIFGDNVQDAASRPLAFTVKNPVPLAYSVYPISDVCKFAFPEPEVGPTPVEFGDVGYGKEATKLLHVVNRASFPVTATLGKRVVDIGAHESIDLPVSWIPTGDASGCDNQAKEEDLVFVPKDPSTPASPKKQSVRLVEHVQTGRTVQVRAEPIDTGSGRSPDYAATERDWHCPADYTIANCRSQAEKCGDAGKPCGTQGYTVNAETKENGCHFGCKGPSSLLVGSNSCKFDAVMECKLKCTAAK